MEKAKKILPIAITLLVFLCIVFGFTRCVESNFLLAEDSRIPKWVKLPEGYSRTDVTVSLFLHTIGKATLIVRGPAPDRKTLLKLKINADWHEATIKEKNRRGNYLFRPHYYLATYNGVNDIIEFPCKGPVFWMTDSIDKNTTTDEPECPPIDYKLI